MDENSGSFIYLLCLYASYIRIADATPAFRDSSFPSMGIRISVSACSVSSSVSPFPSFPMRKAVPLPVILLVVEVRALQVRCVGADSMLFQ